MRSPPPQGVIAEMEVGVEGLPVGRRLPRHLEPDRVHQQVDGSGAGHPARSDRAGRPRHHRLPAELARGDHPGRRHPGVADRHLRRARGASAIRSTPCRCSAWCWRSASSSTTPSSWSRMSSAISRQGLSPREAARRSMDEVSTALVAIVLVLCAVFVPTMFLTGLSGEFYRQFAVTISSATLISLLLSLTLSPALAALLLKPKSEAPAARLARLLSTGRRLLQPRLRPLLGLVRPGHPPADRQPAQGAADLRRPDRRDARPVLDHAGRLRPGAGPGLCAGRGPAAAGKLDRAHRRRAQEGRRAAGQDRRRRGRGDVRRLRRRLGHAGVERRRRLSRLQGLRRARRQRPHAKRRSWPTCAPPSPTSTRRWCSSFRRRSSRASARAASG